MLLILLNTFFFTVLAPKWLNDNCFALLKVLAETYRQQDSSDNEDDDTDLEECVSELKDESLLKSDIEENVFDCNEKEESDGEVADDRDFELGKDKETTWTDKPLRSRFLGITFSNVITHLPVPKGNACHITDEETLSSLFITDELVENIVRHINNEIELPNLNLLSPSILFYIQPTRLI